MNKKQFHSHWKNPQSKCTISPFFNKVSSIKLIYLIWEHEKNPLLQKKNQNVPLRYCEPGVSKMDQSHRVLFVSLAT